MSEAFIKNKGFDLKKKPMQTLLDLADITYEKSASNDELQAVVVQNWGAIMEYIQGMMGASGVIVYSSTGEAIENKFISALVFIKKTGNIIVAGTSSTHWLGGALWRLTTPVATSWTVGQRLWLCPR